MKWAAEIDWWRVLALGALVALIGVALWDARRQRKRQGDKPPVDSGDGPPDKNIW